MISTNNALQSGLEALVKPQGKTEAAAATAASDFQSFLTLLTAQLRHQDPLSPLDSTQFVEQLASFSSVEQQIETNKYLEAMSANFGSQGLDGAVQWIDKEVEVRNGTANYTGNALTFGIPADATSETVQVVVSDIHGRPVHTSSLGSGGGVFTWNGELDTGGTALHGDYTVSINLINSGTVSKTLTPIVTTKVSEVRLENGTPKLVLANGGSATTDEVLAVRNPNQSNTGSTGP